MINYNQVISHTCVSYLNMMLMNVCFEKVSWKGRTKSIVELKIKCQIRKY